MKKVFVDSDIILDLLGKREPFYEPAARLFSLIEQKKIKAHVSPIIFTNLHYILRKMAGKEQAIQSLQKLKMLVKILPVDEKIIDLALCSGFGDFEDAIQFYTAKEHELEYLLTRNKKDYKGDGVSVMSAGEYLDLLN